MELVTARLRLRPWRDGDLDAFAAMSVDREAMAHFPALLSREQAEVVVARQQTFIAEQDAPRSTMASTCSAWRRSSRWSCRPTCARRRCARGSA